MPATLTPPTLRPAVAYELPATEIFGSGEYRGTPWTAEDVRQMAVNAKGLGPSGRRLFVPPVVIGHDEDQEWLTDSGLLAGGQIDPDTVKASPDPDNPGEMILTATLTNIPPEVAEKIASRELSRCSIEIYESFLDDFGNELGKAIRRLALLGGFPPQVKRLKPLGMPQPIKVVKQFSERAVRSRLVRDGAKILTYGEVVPMDRTAACTAIKAAMPGLSQATLDALSDDQLKELVANLPAAPAAAVAATPMAEPTRDEMVAALVAAGQDQATVAAMSDADLKAAFDLVKGATPATPMADDPKPDDKKAACMSEQQKAAAKQLADSQAALAELHRFTEKIKREAVAAQVEPVCADLIKSGLTPAFVNEWVRPQLLALDNTHAIHRFTENGEAKSGTAFQAKLAAAKSLTPAKCFVKFGEKVPGGAGGGDATPEAKKASAVQKARDHAATVGDSAWKQTSFGSADGFVNKFSEAFDKNPETALKMLG